MAHTITVTCPVVTDTDDECEADVEVTLGYEPDDPNYGADADGHRGVFMAGGWYVESVAEKCAHGHTFTAEQSAELEAKAQRAADSYAPEDEYDPPEPFYGDDERGLARAENDYMRLYGL